MKKLKGLYPLLFIICFIFVTSVACSSSSDTPQVISPTSNQDSLTQSSTEEDLAGIPSVTPTKELKAVGASRLNPAPFGSQIISDNIMYSVEEIVRPADAIVKKGNMFNSTPEPGNEYVFVKVKAVCQESADSKCSLSPYGFKIITSTGNITDSDSYISGVDGILDSQDFFGGASVEGYIPFVIQKSEANPILMYEPFLGDSFYLSLNSSPSESTTITSSPNSESAQDTSAKATMGPVVTDSSRSSPAPVGSQIISDDIVFSIEKIVRPADSLVAKGNMFNSTPEPGNEYIFVKIKATCQISSDSKCSLYSSNFKLINSKGNVIDSESFMAGVDGILESQDFFGGATVEGYIPFIIEKTETKPILMYEPFLGDNFYIQIQ